MATILIVDDELMNRELLRAYLGRGGHKLLDAANGYEALEKFQLEKPDLVLLDVLMPGIDGYEVARGLRARSPDQFVPIVLVSALVDREARRRGLEAGADDFLGKPVDSVELRARVDTMLLLRKQSLELKTRGEECVRLSDRLARVRELVDGARAPEAAASATEAERLAHLLAGLEDLLVPPAP